MFDLKIRLEDKKSYTWYWNYFSKSMILKNVAKKILIVVENDKYLSLYEKILRYFWKNLIELRNKSSIVGLLLNNNKSIFIVNVEDLVKIKIDTYSLKKQSLNLKKNIDYDLNKLIWELTNLWYTFSEYFNNGSYRKVWDLIYVISFDWRKEYKISFWWNTIENIWEKEKIDWEFLKDLELEELYIWSNQLIDNEIWEYLTKILNNFPVFTILDLIDFHSKYDELTKGIENFCSFDYIWQRNNSTNLWIKDLDIENIEKLRDKMLENREKVIFTKNRKLIENFTNLNNIENYTIIDSNENLAKSFETSNNIILCDDNISKIFIKRRIRKNFYSNMDLLLKISNWDYIVHIDHWIWIFNWIVSKELNDIKKEYIEIEYKDKDKLFVPISEVQRVSKYIWDENPDLTWLNTKDWDRKLKKVNEDIERIAKELLEMYANRIANTWFKFNRFEEKEKEFQRNFPYIYTECQFQSIQEILWDMNSTKNMDRLLVWDVWFWKTEVAFNSIYTCFLNNKQACFISPLVVLAYEHFEKAKERFRNMWVRIEVLTRLETAKNTKDTLKKLENWEIDLIIWTHKLLGESIKFKNLWLIVVDEEHKFWVEDKEKLKKIKIKVDTLSMSATPIPRSLNMALSNIRDISILKDAPMWRKSINSIVMKFDENTILEWCRNEFARWWQVFFIHNRIENIDIIKNILSTIMPDKKIVIAHWRLNWDELEDRIIDFKNKKYDILLSTTVIENGIDFSNVNTIFINNCENFWLSQIHQLRWRVWRSDRQWYCYLLYKKDNINKDAAKRLKTIVDYNFLGAWFELAMKDLEIRWGWDILGIRQSGQKSDLSVNIYLELLEKKVFELKNEKENIRIVDTVIDLNLEYYLNDCFFNSETDKINFYKEIESIESEEDLDILLEDFKNINWELIKQEKNLFDMVRLRIKASKYKIISIKKIWVNYQVEFDCKINAQDLKLFLELDIDIKFSVVNIYKIRTLTKNFENDEKFLQYMLSLFNKKLLKKKIKLISKK